MSAIAFYDSGRLLPYRHDLKQKQIEQRNIDAENTRKYIGYAGGAFANMAERTGTIFGGRLGKAPAVDSEGEPVAKYGGGTVGAEYAKAEWQKGTLDSESRRREVTHRLGLLTENVKYGNLQRDIEAWKGFDKKVLREAYEKKWDQYLEHSRSMDKIDLIKNYQSMFSKKTRDVYANYAAATTEEDKKKYSDMLMDNLIHAPLQSFEKYAEENEYYDPAIAAKPREDVKLLMAYLREGVKFPGMNDLMDKYKAQLAGVGEPPKKEEEPTKQEQQAAIIKNARENVKVKPELKRTEVDESKDGDESAWDTVAKWFGSDDEAKPKKVKPYTGRKWKEGEKLALEREEDLEPDTELSFDHIQSKSPEEHEKKIEKLAEAENITVVPLITKDYEGNDLTVVETIKHYFKDQWAVFIKSIEKGKGLISGPQPTHYGEDLMTAAEAEEARRNRLAIKSADQALAYARANNLGPTELGLLETKINNMLYMMKSRNEASKIEDEKLYKESSVDINKRMDDLYGTLETDDAEIAEEVKSELDLKTSEENRIKEEQQQISAEQIEINRDSQQIQQAIKREKEKRGTSGSQLEEPVRVYRPELNAGFGPENTLINLMANEYPRSNGEVVEDNVHTLLPGSVDAWQIAGRNPAVIEHVLKNVLKLDGSSEIGKRRMSAFKEYFNTNNVNEFLGHTKKLGELTTDQQIRRNKLFLTHDETEALVGWAYDKNLRTLTNNHPKILNQDLYAKYPALGQLLGDLSYRHGGSFMKKYVPQGLKPDKEKTKRINQNRYFRLIEALKTALQSKSPSGKASGIASMEKELFEQGRYSNKKTEKEEKLWPGELTGPRIRFLKDRFQKFVTNFTKWNPDYKKYSETISDQDIWQ